jgi:tRNA(Ile)-lysidine synthase
VTITITTLRVAVARALNELAHVPPAGATVVLAVSGGVDSMVLWDVLAADARWHLIIYHLDHGLRTEASADLALIQAQARKTKSAKSTKVIGEQADIIALSRTWHCSLETAGRRHRYQRLMTIAAEHGATMVMTGHHLDDQAETVLANLLRGAGPMGRAGMPPERRLAPGIYLARPLLQVRRAEIVAYARAAEIPWLEDHTNQDEKFYRNRLRHSILPTFELGAPGIVAALASLADTAQNDVNIYEAAVAKIWSERGKESISLSEVVTWPADVRLHLWRKLSDTLGIAIERNWLRRIDQLALGLLGQRVHAGE